MFEKFPKKVNQVFNLFLDNPGREFYLRELAKELSISSSTAKRALDMLESEGFLEKSSKANAVFYRLVLNNTVKELKKAKNIDKISRSGILEKLEPSISIILFGSHAKGTDDADSDFDILVINNKKQNYNIRDIEGKEINVLQFTPADWKKKAKKDKPFYQEIITTGIVLKGSLPL